MTMFANSSTSTEDQVSSTRKSARPRYDEELFMMTNLRPRRTGLPMVVYISTNASSRHAARIKVSPEYGDHQHGDNFSITISEEPRLIGHTGRIKTEDINRVKTWVVRNRKTLLSIWNQQQHEDDVEFQKVDS